MLFVSTAIFLVAYFSCVETKELIENGAFIKATDSVVDLFQPVECRMVHDESSDLGCQTNLCGRRIMDGIFTEEDISKLHSIVKKGMATREKQGGPCILDINTGYIRDTMGLDNLFTVDNENAVFSDEDFAHYGRIIQTLKDTVANSFDINTLYFTAPTFITRLNGDIPWEPQSMHDEYWHPHADHNNTAQYHYSGLLYMSTYGEDFTGGKLRFVRPDFSLFDAEENVPGSYPNLAAPTAADVELEVEPRAGRVVVFTAGHENLHQVERLLSGERYVLSFWFTCNKQRQFEIFLDGKAHTVFSHKVKSSLMKQQQQQQKQQQSKRAPKEDL
jgi:hypothetical protein